MPSVAQRRIRAEEGPKSHGVANRKSGLIMWLCQNRVILKWLWHGERRSPGRGRHSALN
jgi:hypothetical protein